MKNQNLTLSKAYISMARFYGLSNRLIPRVFNIDNQFNLALALEFISVGSISSYCFNCLLNSPGMTQETREKLLANKPASFNKNSMPEFEWLLKKANLLNIDLSDLFESTKSEKLVSLEKSINKANATLVSLDEEYCDIVIDISRYTIITSDSPIFYAPKFSLACTLDKYAQTHFSHLMGDKVMMPGILSELNRIDLRGANPSEMKAFIDLMVGILDILKDIGMKNGFVNTTDFTDPISYPILNALIPRVLDYTYGIKPKTENAQELIRNRVENPYAFYNDVIVPGWNSDTKAKFYDTLINLALLHLFGMMQYSVALMIKDSRHNLLNLEIKSLAVVVCKELLGYMGKDIRDALKFRNIKINKVINAGYDTEYQQIDTAKVERLSGQIATTAELQIEVPKPLKYNPAGINTTTGEKYIKAVIPGKGNNKGLVVGLINDTIEFVWPHLYGERSEIIACIDNLLSNRPGVKIVESIDKKVFVISNPLIRTTLIDLVKLNEDNKTWTFESLITDYISPTFSMDLDMICDTIIDEARCAVNNTNSAPIVSDFNSEWSGSPDGVKDFEIEDVLPCRTAKSYKRVGSYRIKDLRIKVDYKITLMAHYNAAEFCLFDDFDLFKKELKILQKSFITMGNGIKMGGWRVTVRDTMLLASAAASSLKALGTMHNFAKDLLTEEEITNMKLLKVKNPEKFKEYAIKDAIITLRHGLFVLNFMRDNTSLNKIPVSLSSLAKATLLNFWTGQMYRGYQLDFDNSYYDEINSGTPKGLNAQGEPGLLMPLYIAASKGGRNEEYLYGRDTTGKWWDWDLNGCYGTIMGGVGNPDYNNAFIINNDNIKNLKEEDLRKSFTVMNVNFKFPNDVQYPVLPAFVDKNIDCYPLEGTSNCTIHEYLLARKLGADLHINTGCFIPFETKGDELINQPFLKFITDVQANRKKYPKGTANERMWKDIGNMVYGQTCQGISGKKSFDTTTGTMLPVPASCLSNPIISSWITGFARAVVGETMNNLNKLGNQIASVTTDGFTVNSDNIEDNLMNSNLDNTTLEAFRSLRELLGHNPAAFELKTAVKGINAWTTRGQLGINTLDEYKNINIVAMTGYQRKGKTVDDLNNIVAQGLASNEKQISFLQTRLRGANDIFKKGGHVTSLYSERRFRLIFDNKRKVLGPLEILDEIKALENEKEHDPIKDKMIDEKIKIKQALLDQIQIHLNVNGRGVVYFDFAQGEGLMLETKPHNNVNECKLHRFVMSRLKSSLYIKNDFSCKILPAMFTKDQVFTRTLMRDYLNREGKYINNSESMSALEFVRYLGSFVKTTGVRQRITKKFILKTLEYLMGLVRQGGFIANSLKYYEQAKNFTSAISIFPGNYLNKDYFARKFFNENIARPDMSRPMGIIAM